MMRRAGLTLHRGLPMLRFTLILTLMSFARLDHVG